jgi:L-amino acid N-acyltransferase YncA
VVHFEQVLEKKGIQVRNFRIEQFEEEIEKIYRVCIQAFKNNFLYTPVEFVSFKKMYEKIKSVLDPTLVKIAEDCNGEPSGFLFAVPDLFDPLRLSAIIKTVAVVPGRQFQGLGTYLGDCTHKEMLQKGYTSVIHALIHESNISGNILSKDSAVYRRYILTGKKLT